MINKDLLSSGNFGIEKENLRILPDATLALSTHEEVFGGKTETVTTDFCESQIEMITPPCKTLDDAYDFLEKIELEVLEKIGDELLWPQSNPPILPENEEEIRISFNTEEQKQYREYLSGKYGRQRGVLSGIHFNYSFSNELLAAFKVEDEALDLSQEEYNDGLYLKVIKYFLKNRWLFIYLTGASPIFHETNAQRWVSRSTINADGDCYIEGMQSFRNSYLGYRNREFIDADYQSVASYILALESHVTSGKLQQLSEFYTLFRLKEKDQHIEYLEMRFLDLNPLYPLGINKDDLAILHLFCIYFSRQEDFEFTKEMQEAAEYNQEAVAKYLGEIYLFNDEDKLVPMKKIADDLLEDAKVFFSDLKFSLYDHETIFNDAKMKVQDNALTYSAEIRRAIADADYITFHLEQAKRYRK